MMKILLDTSIDLGGGKRLHLQYCEFWKSDFKYRFATSQNGKYTREGARIPSRKHTELLWAQADLAGWAELTGESI